MELRKIPIPQIDTSDLNYNISPESTFDPDLKLTESVSRFGILIPPILKEEATGIYLLVDGRKRLKAWQVTRPGKDCYCNVISMNRDAMYTYMVLLEAKLLDGSLSPVEMALFLNKILTFMPPEEAAGIFNPRLGLPAHSKYLQDKINLLNLEEPLLKAVHNLKIDEKTALDLLSLPFVDRLSLYEIIDQLQLGSGKQRKLISQCRRLSKRWNTPITAIIGDQAIKQILSHPKANPPQKATNLLTLLDSKSKPLLSDAEKKFQEFTGRLQLPSGAKLSHAPAFEKDTVTLSLQFKDINSFQKTWRLTKSFFS